jgi:Ser/Thr protein kinase RdoA (MazF antagonist)
VAALRLAAQAEIPVPRLLAHDDGAAAGVPLVLTKALPGSSQIPPKPSPEHLRDLGAVAAHLHAVPLEPTAELPARAYRPDRAGQLSQRLRARRPVARQHAVA